MHRDSLRQPGRRRIENNGSSRKSDLISDYLINNKYNSQQTNLKTSGLAARKEFFFKKRSGGVVENKG